MKTLIKNVYVDNQLQSILIEDNKIKAIDTNLGDKFNQVIDGNGATALPGLVDVHVHFRDPGLTYKETTETGSKASAHGGFTSVCVMPNVKPVVDTPHELQEQLSLNQRESVVHAYQYAAISKQLIAYKPTDFTQMAEMGAIAFTNDGHGVQNAETMYLAMKEAAKLNKPLVAHVEDDSLINGGVMNAGAKADELGLPGMSPLSESSQLARDLVLAKDTGVHYHVAHISTKESVELVRMAKQRGVNVTAEVSPHHLLLDDSMIESDNPMMKMNPPLRSPEDRHALIAGLMDGTIDMVATDHAPHSEREKSGSMRDAAFGIVGIETAFSLMYTSFVKSGLVDLKTLVKWMSKNPADIFHLPAGRLEEGQQADLTLMDLDDEYEIDANDFLSKGKNSPFIGQKVYGKTKLTLVDGNVAYQEGSVE
ncbi:dihydroorotase [Apilactobacillus kunkeei]|uniref:dihydroorotase n=1 Tax=Apilactobacillus kunkeei TaxID=148814 RepID=UPI0006C1315C|nr:dihydroorotase [Apilactobacillus kunkeei]KOY72145.1 Dihydroorotase [Apilactobacillus kunkeei]